MPARIPEPGSAPSLPPERAISILQELIQAGGVLLSAEYDSSEVAQWKQTAEGALRQAFGNDPILMAFHGDAYSSFSYLEMPREEYNEQHREQMTGTLAVLRSGVEQLEWNLPAGAPRFFPAGSQHDAYVEIRNIIKNAVQEVAIIDPYVDSTLWTALKNLPAGVTILVLTRHMQSDFALEAKKFTMQHGNKVEIRKTNSIHDRFIRTDRKRCWHWGASIKDAGAKAFLISEIESPQILVAVLNELDTVWTASTVVP